MVNVGKYTVRPMDPMGLGFNLKKQTARIETHSSLAIFNGNQYVKTVSPLMLPPQVPDLKRHQLGFGLVGVMFYGFSTMVNLSISFLPPFWEKRDFLELFSRH